MKHLRNQAVTLLQQVPSAFVHDTSISQANVAGDWERQALAICCWRLRKASHGLWCQLCSFVSLLNKLVQKLVPNASLEQASLRIPKTENKIQFMQFTLNVAVLECSFQKHSQGILGVRIPTSNQGTTPATKHWHTPVHLALE